MPDTYVGKKITRLEDDVLLAGEATFIDDIQLDGMLHLAVVRSQVAHARIASINVSAARDLPGVAAVYTIDDLLPVLSQERIPENFPTPGDRVDVGPYVLARDEVCYVGEPIVAVIAENRYVAEDAAQLVIVDYDPLPVLADPRDAAKPDAPLVNSRQAEPGNIVHDLDFGHGDADKAFANAAHAIRHSWLRDTFFVWLASIVIKPCKMTIGNDGITQRIGSRFRFVIFLRQSFDIVCIVYDRSKIKTTVKNVIRRFYDKGLCCIIALHEDVKDYVSHDIKSFQRFFVKPLLACHHMSIILEWRQMIILNMGQNIVLFITFFDGGYRSQENEKNLNC